jgi:arginine deiminase
LLLPALPNALFPRDSSCWIGKGLVLCPMYWPARRHHDIATVFPEVVDGMRVHSLHTDPLAGVAGADFI